MEPPISKLDSKNIEDKYYYYKETSKTSKDIEFFPKSKIDLIVVKETSKTSKDIKISSILNESCSSVITKVNSACKQNYNSNSCSQVQELKQKMVECDKLDIPTTSLFSAEDKQKIDIFLQSKNKVFLAVRNEDNLALVKELTSKLLIECKTDKDYIPVMVDLTKFNNPKTVKEKYGEEGRIIGHADYATVFLVYGFEAVKEFNFYNTMSSNNKNFKVILFVPESYAIQDKMLYLPQSSHLSKGELIKHYLTSDSAASKKAAESSETFDVFYV